MLLGQFFFYLQLQQKYHIWIGRDTREYKVLKAAAYFSTFKVKGFKAMQYKILLLIGIKIVVSKSLNVFT